MSVMLATVNPEAARLIGNERPLPGCGDTVIYHLRPGAMRSGQTSVAAWVLKVDESNRQLKLLVVYSHDDMMTEERVPERIGSDYGWEVKPGPEAQIAALRKDVAVLNAAISDMSAGLEAFKLELAQTLFGDHDKPELSFEDRLRELVKSMHDMNTTYGLALSGAKAKKK